LTDDIRPQPAGVEVDASPSGACTLGFNVYFEAGDGFITCAHCTSVRGQVDGDYMGWGVEVRDAPYWTGGDCPSGRWCRYSDSALFHYASVVENGAGNVIARPNARNSTCPSSITIDSSSPTLEITDTDDSPIMNQEVDKIGKTTGWTYGTVTDTCIDLNITAVIDGVSRDLTYICVHEANTKLSPGDSGSPVFDWDGEDGATLMGMIFAGGSNCSSHAYWADLDALQYELGTYSIN
jgi:secreted trypsin-like serine protease